VATGGVFAVLGYREQ